MFGAGAIGIAVGGLLARAGARVVCVARPVYAEALRRGVTLKQSGKEICVKLDAVTSARELEPEPGDLIFITTKSQHTEDVVKELAGVYPPSARVVCFQNGVRNEEIAARRFENVYAGLVFFSAVQLEPEIITMPRGRQVAIGRFPEGIDDMARQICTDLARAGLEVTCSVHVMAMKWSKFLVNLNNATCAITGYYVEQGMNEPEMRRLMLEVREEGLRVVEAAGIESEPPADEPSPIRISEMNEKLRQPLREPREVEAVPESERTYSSMWQDLMVGRKSSEVEFLNGEIVRLGKKLRMPTPYNSALLDVINRMFAEGLRPGLYTPAELRALIRARATESQY